MGFKLSSTLLSRVVYGGVSLAIVASLWIVFRTKPIEVEKAPVARGAFDEKFFVDGKLRSKNKTTVVAFASGDIDEINIKKGDAIRKGEVITLLHWDFHKKIVSPMDGVVVQVHRESAGPVNRGEPLIDIVDPDEIEIVAEPLTSDALRIKEGGSVEVSGFAEGVTLAARVLNVSRAGFVKISALGVEEERTEVRMTFIDAPKDFLAKVGDNFHVELAFLLSHVEDVLKVPLGALFKADDKWAVFVIQSGKAHLRTIEIAAKNDREALVKSGLQEGEQVILFPSDMIKDQTSVK